MLWNRCTMQYRLWKLVRPQQLGTRLFSTGSSPSKGASVAASSRRKFVDRVRIQVSGGHGGRGVQSFEIVQANKKRRVGASGGHGGDVIIRASRSREDLTMQTFVYNGGVGKDASGKGKAGRAGKHTFVDVPCGTVVKEVHRTYILEEDEGEDLDEESDGESADAISVDRDSQFKLPYRDELTTVADLHSEGDVVRVAHGGEGGLGNRSFGKDEDWPETPHIAGTPGELRFLELELKALADVGLVGYPNTGKSTLLRALSRAKPKVASYAFTTLNPVIGTIKYEDMFSLRVADIPGLIRGAHENRGVGQQFLRHVERTRVLIYVIDASGERETVDACSSGDPVEDLKSLQQELQLYSKTLPRRPSVIIANKCDRPSALENLSRLRKATSLPVMECSAINKYNVPLIAESLRWLVENHTER